MQIDGNVAHGLQPLPCRLCASCCRLLCAGLPLRPHCPFALPARLVHWPQQRQAVLVLVLPVAVLLVLPSCLPAWWCCKPALCVGPAEGPCIGGLRLQPLPRGRPETPQLGLPRSCCGLWCGALHHHCIIIIIHPVGVMVCADCAQTGFSPPWQRRAPRCKTRRCMRRLAAPSLLPCSSTVCEHMIHRCPGRNLLNASCAQPNPCQPWRHQAVGAYLG